MIFLIPPPKFSSRFDIASCFIEQPNGKILLLLRAAHKPQGGTWGVPAGKIEMGEEASTGIIREIKEETTIDILPNHLVFFKQLFVRYPNYDFTYNIFHASLPNEPKIKIDSTAHQEYLWVTPQEALNMNLIPDEAPCIKLFFNL